MTGIASLRPPTLHAPVMVRDVLSFLDRRPGGVFVDATVGGGGHGRAALATLPPDTLYVGLDLDPAALEAAAVTLTPFKDRVTLKPSSFRELARAVEVFAGRVTNVLFDLGLSSDQLAAADRGFSFAVPGPLDMRFDRDAGPVTAERIVNTYAERDLADLIFRYGEERKARVIARAIVNARRRSPIKTTIQLAEVIAGKFPGRRRIHPATRTFQALRIAVNDELAAVAAALPQAWDVLAPGGRIIVIAYHSLEDRVVKLFIRDYLRSGKVKALTPKPLRPSAGEVEANRRSRSARLRAAAKV